MHMTHKTTYAQTNLHMTQKSQQCGSSSNKTQKIRCNRIVQTKNALTRRWRSTLTEDAETLIEYDNAETDASYCESLGKLRHIHKKWMNN